jgi:hypothetical protein
MPSTALIDRRHPDLHGRRRAENDGLLIQNGGTVPVFIGGPTVTTSGATAGVPVAASATVTVPTTGSESLALYGIVTTGTANVSFLFPG